MSNTQPQRAYDYKSRVVANPTSLWFNHVWIMFNTCTLIYFSTTKKKKIPGPCRPEGLVRPHRLDRPRAGSAARCCWRPPSSGLIILSTLILTTTITPAYDTSSSSSTCLTLYQQGGAPAVFQSPKCPRWNHVRRLPRALPHRRA